MASLAWLNRRRPRESCSLSEIFLSLGSASPGQGRSSDCEIHLDGNLFFWVAGRLGGDKVLTELKYFLFLSVSRQTENFISWLVRGCWGGSGLLAKSGHHHGGQEEEEEESTGS